MYRDTPAQYLPDVYDELIFGDTPARPPDHRQQGHDPRPRRATRSPATSTAGTRRSAPSSGSAAASRTRRSPPPRRSSARGPSSTRADSEPFTPRRPRACGCTRKDSDQFHLRIGGDGLPIGPPRPLHRPARHDGARRRHVLAALLRGARAARSRLLRVRPARPVPRRRLALRAGGRRPGARRRGRAHDPRRAAQAARRAGAGRRAREGAQATSGAASCSASRIHARSSASGCAGSCSRARRGS